jgi:hypothetical protein
MNFPIWINGRIGPYLGPTLRDIPYYPKGTALANQLPVVGGQFSVRGEREVKFLVSKPSQCAYRLTPLPLATANRQHW